MRLNTIKQEDVLRAFDEAFALLIKYNEQMLPSFEKSDTISKTRQILLENRAAYASGIPCSRCNGTGRV